MTCPRLERAPLVQDFKTRRRLTLLRPRDFKAEDAARLRDSRPATEYFAAQLSAKHGRGTHICCYPLQFTAFHDVRSQFGEISFVS
jgi:hypothetical protein